MKSRFALVQFVVFAPWLSGCAAAMAQDAPAATQPAPSTTGASAAHDDDADVDTILDQLEARGKGLGGFTADVTLSESDTTTGDETTRIGKVWYDASAGPTDARIRVTFEKKKEGNKLTDDKIEYLLSGPNLVDRTYRGKTEVTRQILKPGEKLNLLKLGEGPFPLPIGQKKQDVHAMFDVTRKPHASDDPAKTEHLSLVPKPGTRFANRFASIDVWVGQDDHMPHRIATLDRNESATRTTDLSNVQINPKLSDEDFKLPPVNGEWQLHHEAYAE